MVETLEVIPDPVSLIESMRAVGYSTEAAVADIIDNSLSATATTVQVKYDASDAPFVAVLMTARGWMRMSSRTPCGMAVAILRTIVMPLTSDVSGLA